MNRGRLAINIQLSTSAEAACFSWTYQYAGSESSATGCA